MQIDSNVNLNQVCIYIHNAGEPISPKVFCKLAQLFYSKKSSGTGLGLAITKCIVKAHGGEMLIQSVVAKGTTLSVKLLLKAQRCD